MNKFELSYHLFCLTSLLQKHFINNTLIIWFKNCNLSCKLSNSSISIDKFYYGVYANAQFNLCAKQLCGQQPCYHLVLIR